MNYEHRLCPTNPTVVEVRETTKRQDDRRGKNWRTYMVCDTPAQALRVFALLEPELANAQVRP